MAIFNRWRFVGLIAVTVAALACSDDDAEAELGPDNGQMSTDAGDAGGSSTDAGSPSADAGLDAGLDGAVVGTEQPCCVNQLITTCVCPTGVACNFDFEDCGNGTCVSLGEGCPN